MNSYNVFILNIWTPQIWVYPVACYCITLTMGGSRRGGGGGGGGHTPLKNHKNIGFLSNTGPDPLKNHKTTKQVFNVRLSFAY